MAAQIPGIREPRGALTDVPVQTAKGLAQGLVGESADVLDLLRNLKQQYLVPEQRRKSPQELQQRFPLPTSGAIGRGLEALGVDPEAQTGVGRFAERGARAIGRVAPALATGGLGALTALKGAGAALGAGLTGQVAEEAFGPTAGDIIEILANIAPQALAKKFVPSAAQKSLARTAKTYKIPEKHMAVLAKDPKTFRRLGKIASKGAAGEKFVGELQTSLSNALDELREFSGQLGTIPRASQARLAKSVRALNKEVGGDNIVLNKLSRSLQGGHATAEELVDMYRKVGREGGGARKLTWKIKENIVRAMHETNPELAREFKDLNTLYGNYANIAEQLSPGALDQVYTIGKMGHLGNAVLSGNVKAITGHYKKVLGIEIGRRAVLEYLKSPRTQGNAKKLVTALNANKTKAARQILSRMQKDLEESAREE